VQASIITSVSLLRSLGDDTARPGGLHARLCHVFLVRNDTMTTRFYYNMSAVGVL